MKTAETVALEKQSDVPQERPVYLAAMREQSDFAEEKELIT